MAKYCVDVELIACVSLVIEAPSEDAVSEFFNQDDDYVTGTIIENRGALDDGLGVHKVDDIKKADKNSGTPDFKVNKEGEIDEE